MIKKLAFFSLKDKRDSELVAGKGSQILGPSDENGKLLNIRSTSMWAVIRGGSGIVIMKIIIPGEEMKKWRRE